MVDKRIPNINFGVSLDVDGERFRLTGICPSPAIPTLEALANVILDFYANHLGVRFTIRPIDAEDCDERKD
jgi:hypothetical protein